MRDASEPHVAEPNWISLTHLRSEYEEELDANSRPTRYRHRKRAFTGEVEQDWKPGLAPSSHG